MGRPICRLGARSTDGIVEMNVAVIDIGTNTVLLLVARILRAGEITPLVYEQRVPRLGRGVDEKRHLDPDSIGRVIAVLREYQRLIAMYGPDRTVVCGTSALRDASNREEFARLVTAETGFTLEVLSGKDEAYWTYRGAISGVAGIKRATVIDIGGGSTEIITGDALQIDERISLDIGSVRLTERILRHDPPSASELESAIEHVEDALAQASRFPFSGSTLVGVAGTATALAALAQGLKTFNIASVSGFLLSRETLEGLFRSLRALPSSEIRALSDVMEGRSDVITAGALIAREFMEHFKFQSMLVSERGVRYGIALREAERG
ncbi:MAG TPA: Ppx/GppA family phosphatase [Bacteroidota bacterium]|nr:Ppx/GppA family phosphatase [Bacteroidota bacterium]